MRSGILALSAQFLQLEVRDNGGGQIEQFQTHGHYGLSGMRERVQALEGSFQLRQLEPAGVGSVVNFPLMKNAEP